MIRYKWNQKMQKVFDSNNIDLNTEKKLPKSLGNLIKKGIVQVDECFYSLYVRFGYDYYMYFNTRLNIEKYKNHIEKIGLFVY